MKKTLFHIALFTLLTVFLAASGGLLLIIHHCNAHHVTEISLINRDGEDCCHHATMDHQSCKRDESCCSEVIKPPVTGSNGNVKCCTNNVVFLKGPFQYLKSSVEKIKAPLSQILFILPVNLNNCRSLAKCVFNPDAQPPPDLRISSSDFLSLLSFFRLWDFFNLPDQ